MRVATESTPGESVAVGVFIKSGSRFETDESNGSAHFLEHMFFKGSTNTTQSQLEKKVEQMGCRLNAYTSREQTVYYANVLKKDVGESLGILSEMLLNSTFDAAAIEREKRTILQEMEEVEKVEEEVVFDNLHYTAYQTSPLGRTILGTEENIKNMSRELIVNYIQVTSCSSCTPVQVRVRSQPNILVVRNGWYTTQLQHERARVAATSAWWRVWVTLPAQGRPGGGCKRGGTRRADGSNVNRTIANRKGVRREVGMEWMELHRRERRRVLRYRCTVAGP